MIAELLLVGLIILFCITFLLQLKVILFFNRKAKILEKLEQSPQFMQLLIDSGAYEDGTY